MTIARMKIYAEKRGYYFNGEKNYRGFYKATRKDGLWVTSDSLNGLKRLIDKNN